MRFLHTKGRIHRDLKSANLLVIGNWKVKVANFGSARTLCNLELVNHEARRYRNDVSDDGSYDDDTEETAMLKTNYIAMSRRVGTLLYNAPEILTRQAYGAAIDVYRSKNARMKCHLLSPRQFICFVFLIALALCCGKYTPVGHPMMVKRYPLR